MIPPKDPYIKVRVLDDIGEIALSDQVANLARHAIMFLRRTDAEQYITQVALQLIYLITSSLPLHGNPFRNLIAFDTSRAKWKSSQADWIVGCGV